MTNGLSSSHERVAFSCRRRRRGQPEQGVCRFSPRRLDGRYPYERCLELACYWLDEPRAFTSTRMGCMVGRTTKGLSVGPGNLDKAWEGIHTKMDYCIIMPWASVVERHEPIET